jgi:hypothetical protein
MFNVSGFGSNFVKFKPESIEYNEKSLKEALKENDALVANLGGTEILNPLMSIFGEKPKEGIPRQIFLLTDGEVSNTAHCIEAVKKHARTTRVFTFGIQGASRALIEGMAKAGNGFFEMIDNNQGMEEKLMKQLSRAAKPGITNIEIDWSIPVTQAPYIIPPLFSGDRVVAYAYPESKVKEDIKISMKAKRGANDLIQTVSLNLSTLQKGDYYHKLAAKRLITDIEESNSQFHHKGKTQNLDQEVIKLSTSYNILSKLTAFVAVEERSEATEGEMKIVSIGKSQSLQPTASRLPSAFKGLPSPSYSSPPPPAMQMDFSDALMKNSAAPSRVFMKKEKAERKRSNSPPPAKPSPSSSLSLAPESLKSGGESADATSLPSDARSLLTSQEFGGNWTIENVTKYLKTSKNNLIDGLTKQLGISSPSDSETHLWVVVIVIVYFQKGFPNSGVLYNMVLDKARRFIAKEKKNAASFDMDKWQTSAEQTLKSLKILN